MLTFFGFGLLLLAVSSSATHASFDDFDKDANGIIDFHEFRFMQYDKNADGSIDRDEWSEVHDAITNGPGDECSEIGPNKQAFLKGSKCKGVCDQWCKGPYHFDVEGVDVKGAGPAMNAKLSIRKKFLTNHRLNPSDDNNVCGKLLSKCETTHRNMKKVMKKVTAGTKAVNAMKHQLKHAECNKIRERCIKKGDEHESHGHKMANKPSWAATCDADKDCHYVDFGDTSGHGTYHQCVPVTKVLEDHNC